MAHLTGLHQFGHGAHGLFNGRIGVDAVLIVEVDVIDLKSREACVAACFHVLRIAPDAKEFAVGVANVAELGGEHNPVAPIGDRFSDERFVSPHAVHVGRVEEVAARVQEAVDDAD